MMFYTIFLNMTNAQVILSVPDTTVNASGISITIPFKVSNFNNVSGFNFILKFDQNVLAFQKIQTQFQNVSYNILNGEVRIIYAELNSPININDGVLLNVTFIYYGGSSGLKFSDVAIGNSNALPVSFSTVNGNIKGGKVESTKGTLGGIVWFDANKNDVKDSTDPGVQWVTVDLFSGSGEWLTYSLTDSLGQYLFDSLSPGDYFTRFDLTGTNKKYKFIDSTKDSPLHDFTDTTAYSYTFSLTRGSRILDDNAGLMLNGTGIINQKSPISNPKGFILEQNYPNPFNPSTTIEFHLPVGERVKLTIYNILGQVVTTLFDAEFSAGMHSIVFDASNLSSGVYLYRLTGNNVSILKKMVFSK